MSIKSGFFEVGGGAARRGGSGKGRGGRRASIGGHVRGGRQRSRRRPVAVLPAMPSSLLFASPTVRRGGSSGRREAGWPNVGDAAWSNRRRRREGRGRAPEREERPAARVVGACELCTRYPRNALTSASTSASPPPCRSSSTSSPRPSRNWRSRLSPTSSPTVTRTRPRPWRPSRHTATSCNPPTRRYSSRRFLAWRWSSPLALAALPSTWIGSASRTLPR